MKLTIAHSPDSDDAYMMAPLALGWLDPDGFEIEFIRKDIEQPATTSPPSASAPIPSCATTTTCSPPAAASRRALAPWW